MKPLRGGLRPRECAALPLGDLKKLLATLDRGTLIGKRDATLMLIGFTGAMRRSELVALNVEDVRFVEVGATIEIRRSKTDQIGEGVLIPLPFDSREATCPVHALRGWIDAAGIEDGAIFRSMNRHGQFGERLNARSVSVILKRVADEAGLDSEHIFAHSLRAGSATQAAKRGGSGEGFKRLGR